MPKVKHKVVKASRVAGMGGMIRARIDPALKRQAEDILSRLGLNSSEAIRLFYKQVALWNGLPFEVRVPNATTRRAMANADTGKGLTRYSSVGAMFTDLTH